MNMPLDREGYFRLLRQQWQAPARTRRDDAFAQHAQELDTLYDRLRALPCLAYLSDQLYPEWSAVKPPAPRIPEEDSDAFRHGFYLCNSMMQLMEVVYLDLNLEQEYAHPDNRGWMNLFRHWAWSPMFRLVWGSCIGTYGGRFQSFGERHFILSPGKIVTPAVTFGFQAAIAAPRQALTAEGLSNTECSLIRRFLDHPVNHWILVAHVSLRLYRILNRVELGTGLVPHDLPVGFAVTGTTASPQPAEYCLYLRVRDHLRGAGLGWRIKHPRQDQWRMKREFPLDGLRLPDDLESDRWRDWRGNPMPQA